MMPTTIAATLSAETPSSLDMVLQMPGCFLGTTTDATERYFSEKIGHSFRYAAKDCVCMVLGGPNAYLDEFCQLELINGITPDDTWSPPNLIAFGYHQRARQREYELFLFTARKHTVAEDDAALSVRLWALSEEYRVTIHDHEPLQSNYFEHLTVPEAFRITVGSTVLEERYILPPAVLGKLREVDTFVGLVKRTLEQHPSPKDAWAAVEHACPRIALHVPRSVVLDFYESTTPTAALATLTDAVRNPADAPVLLYRVFQHILEQIKDNETTASIYSAAAQPSDDDSDILDLTNEQIGDLYRIGNITLAMQFASPQQLAEIARLAGKPRFSDRERAEILADARANPRLLTDIEAVVSNK